MSISSFFKNLFGEKPSSGDERLAGLSRKCWLPRVESGDGELTASKFSGIPYLAEGESWPVCPNCGNPIQLFLQLNSADLPAESEKPWGDGLLQFFYCTNSEPLCDDDCEAWSPYAKSTVLRVIATGDNPSKYSESPVPNAFPAKRIVGWDEKDDLPNWEELREYSIDLPEDQLEKLGNNYPRQGEKLLGWPLWVQGIEYPKCPQCGTRMKLLFQVDSNQNIPYDFGDAGVGHISQCPDDPTELAFGWACY